MIAWLPRLSCSARMQHTDLRRKWRYWEIPLRMERRVAIIEESVWTGRVNLALLCD